jgi:PAS domain S-box-containing protein
MGGAQAVKHREILERYGALVVLLHDMNCGFVVRNAEGIVTAVSHRLLQWLGFNREEVEGHPLIDLVPEEVRETNLEAMHKTEKGDKSARLTVLQRKDGSTIPVLVLATSFVEASGEYAGTCSIIMELGTVQTAKNLSQPEELQSTLQRIAIELRSICESPAMGAPVQSLAHPELDPLTGREREVLGMLMSGDRVASISKKLHISPHTVRNHLKSMYRKFDVPSQADLIDYVRNL